MDKSSILSIDQANEQQRQQETSKKISKKCIGILLIAFIISLSILLGVLALIKNDRQAYVSVEPVKLRVALPNLSPFPILLGNSRVIQVLFYSGFDNRISSDYKTVTQRQVIWQTNPEGIVSIDPYGRLQTLSLGSTIIKVISRSSPNVFSQHSIQVIKSRVSKPTKKRVISYEGGPPATLNKVMQKIVTYKTKEEALASVEVPQQIKDIIIDPKAEQNKQVIQNNGIVWRIEGYADGSNRTLIKRISVNQNNRRDCIMYLIGDRYLPGNGLQVLSIEDDKALGIWTVNSKGEVSHIQMHNINYKQKAQIMVENTQKNVLRHGQASSSTLVNGTYIPGYADNDGLWTGLYAAGQFMRFSVLKIRNSSDQQLIKARNSALYSLKAVLLISNIACRNQTIDARIRHLTNTILDNGNILSSQFLKKGKYFAINEYVGSAVDGQGLFGIDVGKYLQNQYYVGGNYKYSFLPIHHSDWSNNSHQDAPATSRRTLNGYIARSFIIEPLDGTPANGLFFRHNKNGTQSVLHQAQSLYDYGKDDHPNLNLGMMELPQILKDFLNINGVQYQKSDLLYKGDTSTDQVIGQLFIYKIAFDILDQSNFQQKTLKELIQSTLVNFCTHLINNGYNLVEATGQGTTWGKITRTFQISDFTLDDAMLQSLQLLMSFKLCYYVTGDQSWQTQYQFLIHDESFRYLDLVASVWRRWTYNAYNFNAYHLDSGTNYSQAEIKRHIISNIHFSDQQQAFLAFYLVFQLQEKQQYLKLYRQALEGWWQSVSRSQNYLWYYIYQLAYPKQKKQDYYGNNILETSSWQLSRHPIDTRRTAAFIQGSRSDVILQGQQKKTLSIDPNHILQKRHSIFDAKRFERKINYEIVKDYDPFNIYEFKILPADQRQILRFNTATFLNIFDSSTNVMFPSTSYTLPYWMGVYHKMLQYQ